MTSDPHAPTEVGPAQGLVDRLDQDSLLGLAAAVGRQAAPQHAYTLPEVEDLHRSFPELEIIELIGSGGMGCVFKARQKKLDRRVALKILPTELARDGLFAERFSREARAMARLNHPNIVSVYDFGQTAGLHYLTMEYMDGMNLRELLDAGSLTPAEALRIVEQVCLALAYAHDEGVIHRDVKPENILFNKLGHVALADFGLARLALDSNCEISLTQTRQAMGTLNYMAPEQWENPKAVDHRADIYALGVLLYETLTGRVPRGSFPPASTVCDVSIKVDAVINRALQQNPADRFQNVAALLSELTQAVQTQDESPAASSIGFGRHGTVTNFINLGAAVLDRLPRPRPEDAAAAKPYTQTQLAMAAFMIASVLICLPWELSKPGIFTEAPDFLGVFTAPNYMLLVELGVVWLLTRSRSQLGPVRSRLLCLILLGFCIGQVSYYMFGRSYRDMPQLTFVPFGFLMLVCLLALEYVVTTLVDICRWAFRLLTTWR